MIFTVLRCEPNQPNEAQWVHVSKCACMDRGYTDSVGTFDIGQICQHLSEIGYPWLWSISLSISHWSLWQDHSVASESQISQKLWVQKHLVTQWLRLLYNPRAVEEMRRVVGVRDTLWKLQAARREMVRWYCGLKLSKMRCIYLSIYIYIHIYIFRII